MLTKPNWTNKTIDARYELVEGMLERFEGLVSDLCAAADSLWLYADLLGDAALKLVDVSKQCHEGGERLPQHELRRRGITPS